MQIQLPKLKRVDLNRPKKKKIMLISDSLNFKSGVATMSRELVVGTAHHFDWVQLGGAIQHPDAGKILDLSADVDKELGIDGSSVKIYCTNGYGTQDIVREILGVERPDVIMLFTDPRHFYWFWPMEHEIRTHWKIPLTYISIWDSVPYPYYNKSYYSSCDLLFGISKQTHQIHKEVLKYADVDFVDLDKGETGDGIKLSYLPHGINPKLFFPITPDHAEYPDYSKFESEFKEKNGVDFIVFANNRNIRRKQLPDVILAFKTFCDGLSKEQASKCCLFMKTSIRDENGTDLMEVKRAICPDYKIFFNEEMLPEKIMNWFYNIAKVTINLGSNEGFGLSNAEAQMVGTGITIQNVTGGLQDQCRFEDEFGNWVEPTTEIPSNHAGTFLNHGDWCIPIFPTNRSLQGSIPTPYIFDDRCRFEDAATAIREVYDMNPEELNASGRKGRKWMLSDESNMSSENMCKKFIGGVDSLLADWKPKAAYKLSKVPPRKKIVDSGVVIV